jgi:hypothetical protein
MAHAAALSTLIHFSRAPTVFNQKLRARTTEIDAAWSPPTKIPRVDPRWKIDWKMHRNNT